MSETIYHAVLINLLRPYPDPSPDQEGIYRESEEITSKIKAAIAKLKAELPPGWKLEVEGRSIQWFREADNRAEQEIDSRPRCKHGWVLCSVCRR